MYYSTPINVTPTTPKFYQHGKVELRGSGGNIDGGGSDLEYYLYKCVCGNGKEGGGYNMMDKPYLVPTH